LRGERTSYSERTDLRAELARREDFLFERSERDFLFERSERDFFDFVEFSYFERSERYFFDFVETFDFFEYPYSLDFDYSCSRYPPHLLTPALLV